MIGLTAPQDRYYEALNLTKAFFPGCEIAAGAEGEPRVAVAVADGTVSVSIEGERGHFSESEPTVFSTYLSAPDLDLAVGRAFYRAASAYTGRRPPWGILTGVRPAKLFLGLTAEAGAERAAKIFTGDYYVSDKKTAICRMIANNRPLCGTEASENECSLYISIPFCPSRCSYCSFVSQDNDRAGAKLISDYFGLLCEEIKRQTERIAASGKTLKTVYVGGGTPAILSPEQLAKLAALLSGPQLTEFTFELGRPDAITAEKLEAVKSAPKLRISINPQTLSDEVLKAIGRRHTVRQFYDAFALAEAAGIDDVNTDIIIGLPKDTPEGLENTLNGIIALNPASITVHSYAKKRSSRLAVQGGADELISADMTVGLHEYCADRLTAAGYEPYYLYRQKDIVGGNENIGWCRDHRFGRYNIYMMDELHSVCACGAGGVAKEVTDGGRKITRFYEPKLPLEYVRHFDEVMAKKEAFYNGGEI